MALPLWSEEELRNLGSEKGIEQEIKKLKKLKEDFSKGSDLSTEEIVKYDDAKRIITELNLRLKELSEDYKLIDDTNSVVEAKLCPGNLTDETYKMYDKIVKEIIEKADKEWNSKKNYIIQTLIQKQEEYIKSREEQDRIIKEIEPKIQQNSAIKEYSELILKEENKLAEYSKKKDLLKRIESQRERLIAQISKVIVEYRDIHNTYGDNVNSMASLSMDGLDFSVTTQFRSEAFKNKISELYDKRQLKARKDIINLDEEIKDDIITEELTHSLITMTLNGIVKLTGGKELENALRELLNDWYNTTYQVKMDADSIEEMSPGKKALVLLKMLINLAESECPILIDQPEDDLDNRSIFEELIPFISKKKVKRQIIIVTHNANVVLGSDAEEIIIANQEGGNSKNNKYRFEYRSGSIENDIPINENGEGVLEKKGIQQQICDILEGGKTAFDLRKNKYRLK